MANGKPGDHPINDIVDHNPQVFSPEIDAMVRQIATLVPRYRMWEMFDWLSPPPVAELEKQVREVLRQLRADAKDRGWELPNAK
jgi:hypothetical protein